MYFLQFLQVPIVAADVTLLSAGLEGAVVLSVYSSDLPTSGFLIPRTVDATAIIFTEPDITITRTSISRKSSYGDSFHDRACDRPMIHFGKNLSNLKICMYSENLAVQKMKFLLCYNL